MKTRITANFAKSCAAIFGFMVLGSTMTVAAPLHANGKIVFTSDRDGNREIYVMNPDGTDQVRITNHPGIDDHAKWSPDGSKIAFVSERPGGGFAIFLMNADGTNKVEITPINYHLENYRVFYWSMSWSPLGDRLVFEDGDDIFVINVDGSGRLNLTPASPERDVSPAWSPDGSRILYSNRNVLYTVRPNGSDVRPLWPPGGGEYHANWSPRGDQIVFAVDHTDDCFWVQAIYVAELDATNVQTVHGGLCTPTLNLSPNWSPDGRKILFHIAQPAAGDDEIFVKSIDGTGLVQLTNTTGRNVNASWQALPLPRRNGKIAFTSDRDGNREIYVMNADGTDQVRLTNNVLVDDHPTWSPNGRQLAFLSQRPTGVYAIFIMNADGTGRTELTPVDYQLLWAWNGWDAWSLSWSPDGRQIVFSDGSVQASTLVVVNSECGPTAAL